MGESGKQGFQLSFNRFLRVGFQGSRVTSNGGLILVRELDERLGCSELIDEHLTDSRANNARFSFADLLRQSVYSRLAGYEDVNDAERRRCCVIRARGEPGREAHPSQYTRSDRGIPSSAIRFSTAHLIAASTFWFLTVRAERLTPSIALYRETAFSATLWRVQPLDFRHT